MLGLYGKHASKGDFLAQGLGSVQPALESWLDAVLAEARHGLAEEWEQVWASARTLRFWIGPQIWGEPVAGVMATSADKVGRRFPLLILALGPDCPPAPVIDASQDWHAAVEAHLRAMLDSSDPPEVQGLAPEVPACLPAGPADFWAVRPDADVAELWADVAMTDHDRAAQTRSYWWLEGAPAQVWAGVGLPSGHVLAWFLRGHAENG